MDDGLNRAIFEARQWIQIAAIHAKANAGIAGVESLMKEVEAACLDILQEYRIAYGEDA